LRGVEKLFEFIGLKSDSIVKESDAFAEPSDPFAEPSDAFEELSDPFAENSSLSELKNIGYKPPAGPPWFTKQKFKPCIARCNSKKK
jgi:hypothetical protein